MYLLYRVRQATCRLLAGDWGTDRLIALHIKSCSKRPSCLCQKFSAHLLGSFSRLNRCSGQARGCITDGTGGSVISFAKRPHWLRCPPNLLCTGYRCFFRGANWSARRTDHLPLFSAVVDDEWSYTFASLMHLDAVHRVCTLNSPATCLFTCPLLLKVEFGGYFVIN
jgi:hypothetical protein